MPEADMQAPKLYFPNTKDAHYKYANFPKVYLEPHEIQSVKAAPPRTIRVLGFKSTSCLKEHHQLRSSSFVYPGEVVGDKQRGEADAKTTTAGVPGSSQVFIALHSAMLDQDQVAFGVFARSHSGGLRLVALLPQEAVSDEEGSQLAAPGFHVIYLPFADDVRQPEMDRAFTGSQVVEPTAAQVAAADALIAHLQLGEFSSDIIANPHLQRHYQVAAEAGTLGKLPISTLKPWLKAKHLPVSGRKDELVERILQHMS
ncbi:ATP-dependent DNA helicase 2 subunit KU70 [Auxenochlorella protothecoides]|uniref:ATP-dependent DNA helicase 2 subunit KU70 n=1 Tax=Auxenochlorella protothecoides TaxID=3075 RepID=A0A087SA99_AUXPR|nr:ATP-dependent DNA helicase 2 subunit KU70 [Auxenochlorella protothecoides]KFM22653.1 ATP-dependent DNA helicase 2 subunit KU70 [Auxenochlorella protothecoides]